MTQAAQPAQPGQPARRTPAVPAAGPPAPPDARARVTADVAAASVDPARAGSGTAAHVDVPRQLNRWQLVVVSACVLFAVLTALLQVLSWNANRAAATNTEQLVRVQNIQSSLLRADSLATSAFLIGGLEPPAQRAAYDKAIDTVTRQIAQAAEAQPADREVLERLNQSVVDYATGITQARDNNRQGFPVGSAYLTNASSALGTDAQPLLTALVDANSERAEDEMGAQRPWLLVLPGLLALLALWWVNRAMAARFRRRFNLGLLAAFGAVAVLTFVAVAVSATQRGHNTELRDGSYRTAVNEATARSAGNAARSDEAKRLINRGSGAAFEDAYTAAALRVETLADPTTLPLWTAYDDLHAQVVALDDSGGWDAAVEQATTLDPAGSTAAFDAFDTAAQAVVTDQARATTSDLRSGNGAILVLALVSLVVGLAAAAACTWGIAARRREYA